jgi:hypothetical protein
MKITKNVPLQRFCRRQRAAIVGCNENIENTTCVARTRGAQRRGTL